MCRAHPRSRGENSDLVYALTMFAGSSPLTRGKPFPGARGDLRRRLIPAHAGKTSSTSPATPPSTAHPRSRGENSAVGVSGRSGAGSSPLTRGKRQYDPTYRTHSRLIPAHAGKTGASLGWVSGSPAHPRSRGENQERAKTMALNNGSSPLTRGKRCGQCCARGSARLIPAHAGKTEVMSGCMFGLSAHPRSRGENALVLEAVGLHGGSSPLTRGKRRVV